MAVVVVVKTNAADGAGGEVEALSQDVGKRSGAFLHVAAFVFVLEEDELSMWFCIELCTIERQNLPICS